MKVGLYGIQGVYNFGCEAIIRGAFNFIKDIYPDSEVIYFSFSASFDEKVFENLDLKIVSLTRKYLFHKKVINKILKTINSTKRIAMFDMDSIIDSVDMFVSIGGDIYTIPQILRNKNKYPYYNPLVDFCDRAIKKGKKVIVYGASVGPWGNYKKAVNYNVNALRKYKAILCREEETIGYLHSLGLKNAFFFPDPAFQVRSGEVGEKKYIGINLSPLSLKELYGSYGNIYVKKLADLIDRLYEVTRIDLLFIPHVLSSDESDNDLLFMKKIQDIMVHKENVVFADSSNGFVGLKKYIAQCYVVVAARMHCAVNAIDENIPAIFLAYSQKSIGMCKYVYKSNNYLIDLKNIECELIDKVVDTVKNSNELSSNLMMRNKEIKQYYESNIGMIRKLIEK